MKNIINIAIILLLGNSINGQAQEHKHQEDTTKSRTTQKKVLSPHTYVMKMIGEAHIHIDYSSPGVRNRIIFGGLLPYNEVWQAGAHKATWIETNKDLIFGDKTLPVGKYGFFVIPSEGEWTIIFNTHWEQHGKDDYDEKDDVIRLKVRPVFSDSIVEHLEYKIDSTNETQGAISLSWEKVSISFPFSIK